jgi:single-stranded DNA-binding protein
MNETHNFSFRAIGKLARNPEVVSFAPGKFFTRFCLVTDDHVVDDTGECRLCVTTTWLMAVDEVGDEIMVQARKGDLLVVEGVVLRRHWGNPSRPTNQNQPPAQDFVFLATGYACSKRGAR